MKVWFEIEILLYGTSTWRKTARYVGGIGDGFPTQDEAQKFADSIPSWGDSLYEDSERRVVCCTRGVVE